MIEGEIPGTLHPPAPVLDIAQRLEKAGFETWCVGGSVRDALLGHEHLDWDLATAATPEQVRTLFGHRRTIPVGIAFGTVGVLEDRAKVMHEVTTFRRDVRTDGRHAEVEFGVTLDDDLARRDFTINAIAYSPSRRVLHDPFGGRDDLARGLVRTVGDPNARMHEDRLRALRGIRFAARFNFAIDPATWQAIVDSAPHLTRLSAERVKQELEKTMDQVSAPSVALRRWREAGALHAVVPALAGVSDETLNALDALAMPGLASRPNRRIHRLAALFSDVSPSQAIAALTALRCSKHEISWIGALVERWHAIGPLISEALIGQGHISDAQVRRWVAMAGRLHLPGLIRVANARWAVRRASGVPAPTAAQVHALYRRLRRAALRDPVDLHDLAVDGDDLRRAGVQPGPRLGQILLELLDWVLDDPRRNLPSELLARATELARLPSLGTTAREG